MTLIAQANILDKLNQRNLFRQRTSTTEDDSKTLSFNVYSTRHFIPTSREAKHQRIELPSLPTITRNAGQSSRRTRRPSYRTSVYHSILSNVTPVALPVVNNQRSKPKPLPLLRDESLIHFQHHPDPPPTPSDDSIQPLSLEANRTRQMNAQFSGAERDEGLIPYRLPVLSLPTKPRPSGKYKPMRHVLSDYYRTFYLNH